MSNEMGEMHTTITAKQLASEMEISVERVGQLFRAFRDGRNPHFAGPFSRFAELTPIQVAYLKGEDLKVETNEPEDTEQAAPFAADVTMRPEQGPSNEAAPQGDLKTDNVRRWPLWVALAITAGASVPNMVEVTTAMKGSSLVAWAMTAVFTLIPGLLIAARLRGLLWGLVVVGVMGYTAFCNASAIFGGLTALDKGYILRPTVFLEAVTNMLNTDYLNTARALSGLMALLIGGIEFVAFKNLSK